MQNIAIFDLVIITITLLLGLKGLFRGIIKEIFGIIGIIGAIFVASRISTQTGELIAPVLVLENQATIKRIFHAGDPAEGQRGPALRRGQPHRRGNRAVSNEAGT